MVMPTQRADDYRVLSEAPAKRGFDEFFRRNYLKLGRTLYLLAGSRGDAEDLAQEAFIRVYVRWERVEHMESPDGYLYQVALNLYRRSLGARRVTPVPLDQLVAVPQDGGTDQVESQVDLLRVLQRLPVEQREAFALVEWLGLDSPTAATLLGIAPASVRGRLFRARRAVRRLYFDESGGTENE